MMEDYLPPHSSEVLNLGSETLSEDISADADLVMEKVESASMGEKSDGNFDLSEIAKMVPNKMAFKIGDVADIAGIKPYVLRYWESEFDALNPQKSAFNQRMYSKKDVETVLLIKKLLYDEKFSIAGAKKKIRELRKELKVEKHWVEVNDKLETVSERLADLLPEIASMKSLFS